MQEEMGLPQQEDVMLLGIVSRLADHKALTWLNISGKKCFRKICSLLCWVPGSICLNRFLKRCSGNIRRKSALQKALFLRLREESMRVPMRF